MCQQNQCVCSNGNGTTGTSCPVHGESRCTACSSGYHLENTTCEENVCTCAFGTAARGTACPQHGASKCVAPCNQNFALSSATGTCECAAGYRFGNQTCEANVCSCQYGTPASGAACTTHGANICVAPCNANFVLLNNVPPSVKKVKHTFFSNFSTKKHRKRVLRTVS